MFNAMMEQCPYCHKDFRADKEDARGEFCSRDCERNMRTLREDASDALAMANLLEE